MASQDDADPTDKTLEAWQDLSPRPWLETLFLALVFLIFASVVYVFAISVAEKTINTGASLALMVLLAALAIYDIRYRILPDILTVSLIGFGLVWNYWVNASVLAPLLGAIIGYSVFWLFNYYWKSRTGNTGLGLGDAKLLAGGGALLGPLLLPFVVLLSSGLALITVFVERVRSSKQDLAGLITFGPFICAAIWALWCYQ